MQTIDGEKADLAKRFVENFYSTYDANRADLANLYHEDSMLILDGHQFRGKEAIIAKLTSLPFQQSQHHITTINAIASDRETIVIVIGDIRLDGQQDARVFTEGTQTREKNELLIRQFNIDHITLPILFRQGSSVFGIEGEDSVMPENGTFEEVKTENNFQSLQYH